MHSGWIFYEEMVWSWLIGQEVANYQIEVLNGSAEECRYIEQWGRGIRRIKSSCKTRGLKEPEIVEKGDFVDVSLYREMAETKQVHKKITELTEQEKAIIEYLKREDNRITTQDVKSILDIEDRRARIILKGLVDRGLIERKGGGPSTFYQIKQSGNAG